jgi:hypothetical protein
VEHPPSKHGALSSNPTATKKEKMEKTVLNFLHNILMQTSRSNRLFRMLILYDLVILCPIRDIEIMT